MTFAISGFISQQILRLAQKLYANLYGCSWWPRFSVFIFSEFAQCSIQFNGFAANFQLKYFRKSLEKSTQFSTENYPRNTDSQYDKEQFPFNRIRTTRNLNFPPTREIFSFSCKLPSGGDQLDLEVAFGERPRQLPGGAFGMFGENGVVSVPLSQIDQPWRRQYRAQRYYRRFARQIKLLEEKEELFLGFKRPN